LAILWVPSQPRAAQRQCPLAEGVLKRDRDVQPDIDRSQYFAAILADRRRLRMAWDAEPKHLSAGQEHPPLDARLLYVPPEEFQKPN
jgi:hypothetical protein